jgi:uncharacterized phage-associated protein
MRTQPPYYLLTNEQMDKIGNAMIFLAERIPNLSKTKMLKLLYVLDELSISRSGIPFFNLQYKVWKLGPVAEGIFVELSDKLYRLDKYVATGIENGNIYINPKTDFCDDEFSDNDIELLEFTVKEFRDTTAKDMIAYTHRPTGLWYHTATANGLLQQLESGLISNTDIIIDMGQLVLHDERKRSIYTHYIEEN